MQGEGERRVIGGRPPGSRQDTGRGLACGNLRYSVCSWDWCSSSGVRSWHRFPRLVSEPQSCAVLSEQIKTCTRHDMSLHNGGDRAVHLPRLSVWCLQGGGLSLLIPAWGSLGPLQGSCPWVPAPWAWRQESWGLVQDSVWVTLGTGHLPSRPAIHSTTV